MNEKLVAKNMNLLKLQRYQKFDEDALVRLGTASWDNIRYRGTLYDYDTPINEFLKTYAAQYDAAEYRESFVDVPSERKMLALKTEIEGVNKNFKFCPTIPRRVSHEFELGENIFNLKEFLESVELLGEHLGPCILRLPETFATTSMKNIFKFLKLWPTELRLAIHFTHLEAFKSDHLNKLVKELKGSLISLLIEDRIEAPIVSERLLNSDHLILRFYGRPGLNQDDQRLAMWVYKLGEYKAYGIKNPYFFLHEQEEMCLGILKRMANSMGGNIRIPASFDVNSKQMGFSF